MHRKKILVFLCYIALTIGIASAQYIQLYVEDFENPSPDVSLNSGSVGTDSGNNQWVINNVYSGAPTYPNTMRQDSTYGGVIGNAPFGTYMHINNTASSIDNANYDPASASDRFTEISTSLCTTSMDTVHFSFFYLCEGSPTAYGQAYYRKNFGAWLPCGQPMYSGKYKWKYEEITDPAFAHCENLQFGFRWVNDNSASPANQSFSIDDIDIVGYYDNVVSPITITVSTVSPLTVCQANNITVFYEISDSLCDGSYSILLSNATGSFASPAASWVASIYFPQTSGAFSLTLPSTAVPGTCYRIRISRVSPLPAITGIESACFTIISCPNVITTLQPAVTKDTNAVCIRSVIDIPFTSTGVFNLGNTYTAQLSDASGAFGASPTVLGTSFDKATYDPALGSPPGSVSGLIPNVAPGCNYYIRVISDNPVAIGAIWGPFCIQQCDMITNNNMDLQFCVTDCAVNAKGDSTTITINVNEFNTNAQYGPGNVFTTQLIHKQFFTQIGPLGILGSVAARGDTLLKIKIPCKDSLAFYGLAPGSYYMRVIATNSVFPDSSLGSLIRVSLGAPRSLPRVITSYNQTTGLPEDEFCSVAQVRLQFNPYSFNEQSTYRWRWNLYNGGNPFVSPSGANSNTLFITQTGADTSTFTIQETNYGCLGPWMPMDTIIVYGLPNVQVQGPTQLCVGDTGHFSVTFANNTFYNWTISPNTTVVNQSNTFVDNYYPNAGNYTVRLDAVNMCGSAFKLQNITVYNPPIANAGIDQKICENTTVALSTPAGTGYSYSWSNGSVVEGTSRIISVTDQQTTTHTVTVTGPGGCVTQDAMLMTVQHPAETFNEDEMCLGIGAYINLISKNTGPEYLWSDGTTNDNIFAMDTGKYWLSSRDPLDLVNLCPYIEHFYIKQVLPTAQFKQDSLCKGQKLTLDAEKSFALYSWNNGETTQQIQVTSTGIYSVIVNYSQVYCTNTINYTISNKVEQYYNYRDTILCKGDEIVLDAGWPGSAYTWKHGGNTQTYAATDSGNYEVAVIPAGEVCTKNVKFRLEIGQCPELEMPNIFTPNNDGFNEVFTPKKTGKFTTFDVMIFDRWGKLLFESTNPFFQWPGTNLNGDAMPSGTYYYVLHAAYKNTEYKKRDWVQLMR